MYFLISRKENTSKLSIIGGIISLTRPEAIMYALTIPLIKFYEKKYIKAIKILSTISIIFTSYVIFRWIYYGQLFANTTLNKIHPNITFMKNGLSYLYNFNAESAFIILPLALIGFILNKKNHPLLFIPFIFILLQIIFLMVSGGDFMYGYRFTIPIVPALIILISSFIDYFYFKLSKILLFIISIFIILIISIAQFTNLPSKTIKWTNITQRDSIHFEIAKYLNNELKITSKDTILLSEAGIIPFYVKTRIIDYLGLVSNVRSVYKNSQLNLEYIFKNNPNFVILTTQDNENQQIVGRQGVDQNILDYSEFKKNYKLIKRFYLPHNTDFLNQIYYKHSQSKQIYFDIYKKY
jgi:hypothetical protein